jgi:hypothetical protein
MRTGRKWLGPLFAIVATIGLANSSVWAQALNAIDQAQAPKHKHVILVNNTSGAVTVYISFGADSAIKSNTLPGFCVDDDPKLHLKCHLSLSPGALEIPNPSFLYLNIAVTFNGEVGCGTTKAELTANHPSWYDNMDVSEVDGFSNKVELNAISVNIGTQKLGPARGLTGNKQLLGVYPYKCTICTDLGSPEPCPKLPPGNKQECKLGTENNPQPPCHYQMNDPDGTIKVILQP